MERITDLPAPGPREPKTGLADGELRDAVEAIEAGDAPELPIRDDRVHVEVLHSMGAEPAAALIQSLGGEVTGSAGDTLVEAWVPLDQLEGLEERPGIDTIRTIVDAGEPEAAAGLTGSRGVEAVTKTSADAWHRARLTGAGVKVGIIDSFDGGIWTAAANAGELPPAVAGAFCLYKGSACNLWTEHRDRHGVAVAEIILDMAPGASLYLANVESASDLRAAVDWFAANGVRVISRSETAQYDGPGNGTGELAGIVDRAVSKGMVWFNSAGNSGGDQSTRGSYWRGSWYDPDGDGWLNFSGGDELLAFDCTYINGLRWSDWGSNRTDYDLYIADTEAKASAQDWYRKSEDAQGDGAAPIERPALENYQCGDSPDYDYLAVKLYASNGGTSGDVLEFMTNGYRVEYPKNRYSASGPVADTKNAGALAVGAVDPWNGTAAAVYSAQGPTNDNRTKPDLSAVSCVTNFSYGLIGKCFAGTSAATPAAAGAAALVRQRWPGSSPAQVKSWLLGHAVVDRGTAGWDNVFGAGEIRLPSPAPPNKMPFGEIVLSIVDGRRYGLLAYAIDPETSASPRMRVTMEGVASSEYDWNHVWPELPARTGWGSTQSLVYLAVPPPGTRNVCVDAKDPQSGTWVNIGCRSISVK
jgi:hypothetical protein